MDKIITEFTEGQKVYYYNQAVTFLGYIGTDKALIKDVYPSNEDNYNEDNYDKNACFGSKGLKIIVYVNELDLNKKDFLSDYNKQRCAIIKPLIEEKNKLVEEIRELKKAREELLETSPKYNELLDFIYAIEGRMKWAVTWTYNSSPVIEETDQLLTRDNEIKSVQIKRKRGWKNIDEIETYVGSYSDSKRCRFVETLDEAKDIFKEDIKRFTHPGRKYPVKEIIEEAKKWSITSEDVEIHIKLEREEEIRDRSNKVQKLENELTKLKEEGQLNKTE
jgi:hypothetical protein